MGNLHDNRCTPLGSKSPTHLRETSLRAYSTIHLPTSRAEAETRLPPTGNNPKEPGCPMLEFLVEVVRGRGIINLSNETGISST